MMDRFRSSDKDMIAELQRRVTANEALLQRITDRTFINAAEEWKDVPVLGSNIQHYDANNHLQYRRNSGRVDVRGAVLANALIASASVVASVPPELAPTSLILLGVVGDGGALGVGTGAAQIQIQTDGDIITMNGILNGNWLAIYASYALG